MSTTQVLGEPQIRCSSCMARVPLTRSVRLEGGSRIFCCPRCHASYPVFGGGAEGR